MCNNPKPLQRIDMEDISGQPDPIETLFGTLFLPTYTQRLMNRNNNQDPRNYRNLVASAVTGGEAAGAGVPGRPFGSRDVLLNLMTRLANAHELEPIDHLGSDRRNGSLDVPILAFNTIINHWGNGDGEGGIADVIQNSFNDTGGVIKRAKSEFISSLTPPTTVPEECVCGVCQDEVTQEDRETLLELPCKHIYHKDCIMPWFKKSNTCPVCREEFDCTESPVAHHTSEQDAEPEGEQDAEPDGEGEISPGDSILEMMRSTGLMVRAIDEVVNTTIRNNGSRDSMGDEDTMLQEMILRSLRDNLD
jgi:hypothetical protein